MPFQRRRRNKGSHLTGNLRYGRKVFDAVSDFPTQEGRLVEDESGYLVDPRYGTWDVEAAGERESERE